MTIQFSVLGLLLLLAGFCINRAAGGVIGEYAKRSWFSTIEPWIESKILKLTCRARHRLLKRREERDRKKNIAVELSDGAAFAAALLAENNALRLKVSRLEQLVALTEPALIIDLRPDENDDERRA